MAQDNDRHLTTEQLSALLDKQLPADEQATYEAHLNTCRQCQRAMANLRQTVALLHALPQPPLPRSFTLPASIGSAPEEPENVRLLHPVTTTAGRGRDNRRAYIVRRTVRAISTIAAVIGLVFLLSSFVASLPHGGFSASTSAGTTNSGTGSSAGTLGPHPAATSQHALTPNNQCNNKASTSPCSNHTPVTATPTPAPTQPTAGQNVTAGQRVQANAPPDLNSPQAHLAYGAILLLLGILGVALTRRRRE